MIHRSGTQWARPRVPSRRLEPFEPQQSSPSPQSRSPCRRNSPPEMLRASSPLEESAPRARGGRPGSEALRTRLGSGPRFPLQRCNSAKRRECTLERIRQLGSDPVATEQVALPIQLNGPTQAAVGEVRPGDTDRLTLSGLSNRFTVALRFFPNFCRATDWFWLRSRNG